MPSFPDLPEGWVIFNLMQRIDNLRWVCGVERVSDRYYIGHAPETFPTAFEAVTACIKKIKQVK